MKRIVITGGAALLVLVPAVVGFSGSAAFAHSIPASVPSQAAVAADNSGKNDQAQPANANSGKNDQAQPAAQPANDNSGKKVADDSLMHP